MGKWSGAGQPPTRKKIHRRREVERLARKAEEKMDKAEAKRLARQDREIEAMMKGCEV